MSASASAVCLLPPRGGSLARPDTALPPASQPATVAVKQNIPRLASPRLAVTSITLLPRRGRRCAVDLLLLHLHRLLLFLSLFSEETPNLFLPRKPAAFLKRIKSPSLIRRRNPSPQNLAAPRAVLGFELMAVEEASSSSGGGRGGGGGGGGEEGLSGCGGGWTREQEKAFENALATVGDDEEEGDGLWEKLAEAVEGKTADEVRRHYELLGSAKSAEQERRKGIAWTEDEHRLFLLGLEKYGKGDWRSISRNFVISRTPTQVASHAQKYFIRLNSMNRERRRSSIHDITSVNNGDTSAAQGPITGQPNGPSANPGKSSKQSPQPANAPPGVDAYGTTIGQPVGGPLVSAVGTPVTLPVPAAPHIAYGMHAPVPGAVVPGAPVNMPPMPYPMPPPTSHG
uniref:Uncharacterized protein n=1 Tax=Oryza nivara TaxID=4536 RepID=A0A0E0H7G7_ORYNI